jgi:nucleotide-binding universal stress UspA family protein
MLPIHTILHPTDFSPQSDAAFRVAAALARDYKARLVLVHVQQFVTPVVGEFGVMPVSPEEDAEVLAAKLREYDAGPGVRIEHRVLQGDPVSEIIDLARTAPVDVIVMGTHGRRGVSRLLMGSVAELVVRRAECLVLTVKSPMTENVNVDAIAEEEMPHEEPATR